MSNSFGRHFRITTWGESHGPAVGVVIDGCPAGLELSDKVIRRQMERDIPEPSIGTTRHEPNEFKIMSGVFDGKTLGTPISIIIPNSDVDSKPYKSFAGVPRPGHADLTWWLRYGWVDPRGGGRASGRECIARLAAGAIAQLLLKSLDIEIKGQVTELAGVSTETAEGYKKALERVQEIGAQGNTSGGCIEVTANGVPAGLGAPVFNKLQADLAAALMTIGGVKAIEIGAGRQLASMTGDCANDKIEMKDGQPQPQSNNCGGLLGGITTGGPLVIKMAVKPTPTHHLPQSSVDINSGEERTITCHGRHDLNFTPRVAPIAEAMVSLVLVDHAMASGLLSPVRFENKTGEVVED